MTRTDTDEAQASHSAGMPAGKIKSCRVILAVSLIGVLAWGGWMLSIKLTAPDRQPHQLRKGYFTRHRFDTGGNNTVGRFQTPWHPDGSLDDIAASFRNIGTHGITQIDEMLSTPSISAADRLELLLKKAILFNYEGSPQRASEALQSARDLLTNQPALAQHWFFTIVAYQGITALRQGENENCILCRGESSCILPVSSAARHVNPRGSRLAIQYFTEYLQQFPHDLEIRWLLNLAHMTLGQYPQQVNPRYLVSLNHFQNTEFDIGRFRDIGHKVGVNHLDQAGGAIMDDFDNDGFLDLMNSCYDPLGRMHFYRNNGQGRFEERAAAAGLDKQLGGLNCVQTDYNNDGYLDVYVMRGAWQKVAMRPSLLRNNKDGTFTDVTAEVGLLTSANCISATWADYDNDGWLDLWVCGEKQSSRLYRNLTNGRFEDVTLEAGLHQSKYEGKGAAWIDFDNDRYPDLFVNYYLPRASAQFFRNNRDGTFCDATSELGIKGPVYGFSCWAWDYNNDGWLDIFATGYDRNLNNIIDGLLGRPRDDYPNRLYRNQAGRGFVDVTQETGLNVDYAAMGSNFADFDNDGFLDMYLGTGDPEISMLIPNRLLKNVSGHRFSDITANSGTGSLQKGHGVACGDWNRDGNVDIFIEMGGAIPGDQYHNILFQNPGQKHPWLTLKLIGKKSNRVAIGARIKIVTRNGDQSQTIHRHITSGSSFGANPLQQTIGLGPCDRITRMEINWPTSDSVQVFEDVAINQSLEITEFADTFRRLNHSPIPIPEGD